MCEKAVDVANGPIVVEYSREVVNAYKKRKEQKAQIKEELLPIVMHPDRVVDWCFDEDEKNDLEKLWS